MIRWLCELGLEPQSAHILMGQCVEYHLGNMFDPAYTMICRMKKEVLEQLGLELSLGSKLMGQPAS